MHESFIVQYTEFIKSCTTVEQVDNLEVKIEKNYGLIPETLKKVFMEKREEMMNKNTINKNGL